MISWRTPWRYVADLLLPRACVGCDRPISGADEPYCPACAGRLLADTRGDYCPRCGQAAEPYLTTPAGCAHCRERHSPIEGLARAGTYDGVVGDIVKRFKLGRLQRLDRTLGTLLADAMRKHAWCAQVDALVPVPLDWRGWWQYRFNPADLIARCVGRNLGLPTRAVVRVHRKRRPQKGLTESERIANIRGAFRLAWGTHVTGRCLCVIDDVCTSGATLREMGRVLKAAGAARVFGAVAARTQLGAKIES